MTTTERPSKVDGLIICGEPGRYRLLATRPDGTAVDVETGPANKFRTVADANAAALRLTDVLPWGSDTLMDAVKSADHHELRGRLVEGLTGLTLEEIRQRDEAERQRVQEHYDGTGARQFFTAQLADLGHAVTWKRKGQRTFHGRCDRCGETYRSSYRSISDSYHRTGRMLPCSAIAAEAS